MRDVSKSLNYIAQIFSRKNICLCKTGEVKFEKKKYKKKLFVSLYASSQLEE